MATVGPKLTIPFTIGTDKIVGQGNQPEAWVMYSVDDAAEPYPEWLDATPYLRGFSVSRGRNSERGDIDTGTAEIRLDNSTRVFDPVVNTGIKPMNRWRLWVQFSSETQSVFVGYAEAYDQQWPGTVDAETTVRLADEFKVLALDALPTTEPPRNTYQELVQSDRPDGYWALDDDPASLVQAAEVPPAQPAVAPSAPTGPVWTGSLGDTWGWSMGGWLK